MKAIQRPHAVFLGLVILLFYGGLLVLWLCGYHDFNRAWTGFLGVDLGTQNLPGRPGVPFFDLAGTLSWRDCHLKGLDVMATNPCDPFGRISNYSPFWYLLPTGGRENLLSMGFLLDGAFLAVLPPLLRPASMREGVMAALAAISSSVLFAVVRANVDLLMFLMILAALGLWHRGRGWPAYGVIWAAALLKFYPAALLGLAVREPGRRFALVAGASLVLVIIFAAGFWDELVRLPALMPQVIYFGDNFGAGLFGMGVTAALRLDPIVGTLMTILLMGLCCLGAWRGASCVSAIVGASFWKSWEGTLLLGGALVMVSCFFLLANVAYRAIFLLLPLPGFFVLWRMGRGPARLAWWSCIAILFCLNAEPLRRLSLRVRDIIFLADDPSTLWDNIPQAAFFVLREAVWWSLMTLLLSFILAFWRQAPALAGLRKAP